VLCAEQTQLVGAGRRWFQDRMLRPRREEAMENSHRHMKRWHSNFLVHRPQILFGVSIKHANNML
jgi:hypothetical protein